MADLLEVGTSRTLPGSGDILDNLYFLFQPIVTRHGLAVAEALVRCSLPGYECPSMFLPRLEREAAAEFTALTIATCVAKVRSSGHAISFNLSPQQLLDSCALDLLRAVPEQVRSCLVVEVTEHFHPKVSSLKKVTAALQQLGVKVWLDDVLADSSDSLLRINSLSVDGVKLDMSFARNLHTALPDWHGEYSETERFVQFLLESGLTVVAEGIETEFQLELFNRAGCTFFQGFYLGKPGPLLTAA